MGYGVSGDGFQCCRWFEVDGVWLILSLIFGFVRWVSMGFKVGFGSISVGVWLAVGCKVAHGGFVEWLAVVVSTIGRIRQFWMWVFFCFFVFLFYVAPNTQCKIFIRSFS